MYETTMLNVRGVLTQAFKNMGAKDESAAIIEGIKSLGGVTEESLTAITADDLIQLGTPVLTARRIVAMFTGKEAESADDRRIVVVNDDPDSMAQRLKPEELVKEYDPNNPHNAFGKRLTELSQAQPFLVFKSDGTLDVSNSARLLREYLDGYGAVETTKIDGKLVQTYIVGNMPARHADEHPLFVGKPLRPNGMSDGHIEWGSLSLEVRQFTRIAREQDVWKDKKEMDAFDDVVGKTIEELRARYPQIALKYDEKKGTNNLPSLKVQLRSKSAPVVPAPAPAVATK